MDFMYFSFNPKLSASLTGVGGQFTFVEQIKIVENKFQARSVVMWKNSAHLDVTALTRIN